jgi:hypothetical protein
MPTRSIRAGRRTEEERRLGIKCNPTDLDPITLEPFGSIDPMYLIRFRAIGNVFQCFDIRTLYMYIRDYRNINPVTNIPFTPEQLEKIERKARKVNLINLIPVERERSPIGRRIVMNLPIANERENSIEAYNNLRNELIDRTRTIDDMGLRNTPVYRLLIRLNRRMAFTFLQSERNNYYIPISTINDFAQEGMDILSFLQQ